MPVDESLQTEINSAITEAVEVVNENAAADKEAAANATITGDEVEKAKAATEADEQAAAQAELDRQADEEAADAAEAEAVAEKAKAEAAEKDKAKAQTDEELAAGELAKKKAIEPAKPTISDYALLQAERVGIDPDVACQFPDEGSLLRAVISITERMQAAGGAAGEEEDEDILSVFPELDPEVFEKETLDVLTVVKGILQKQNDTIKEMQSQHKQVATNSQQASAAELERWFDTQVEGLGTDFADALGAGGYSSLDRGSSQFAKRDAIARQMTVLLAGYQATGAQAPPREQVFDSAAKIVLHDEFGGLKEKKLASSLAKRSKQHIARANGQTSKNSESPQDETAAILDKKYFSK